MLFVPLPLWHVCWLRPAQPALHGDFIAYILGITTVYAHSDILYFLSTLRVAESSASLAKAEVIPFHRDHSLVVVNVAINDGFEGGKLMFALMPGDESGEGGVDSRASNDEVEQVVGDCGGGTASPLLSSSSFSPRILSPSRLLGCATAHNQSAVHGVSRLVAGVRYGFFAVYDDKRESVAAGGGGVAA